MPAIDQQLPYWNRRPAFPSHRPEAPLPRLSPADWKIIGIERFWGVLGLIVGVMAQVVIIMDLFAPHAHDAHKVAHHGCLIGLYALILPILALWVPVFCNQPLMSLPAYLRWSLYMSCCSVAPSLILEICHGIGWLPVPFSTTFAVARVMMYAGCISFIPHLHLWILRRKSVSP